MATTKKSGFVKKRQFRIRCSGEDVWEAVLHPDLQIYMQRSPKFYRLPVPEGVEPEAYITELLENKDERISDFAGPCGAIEVKPMIWCFFGWWRPDTEAPERGEKTSLFDLLEDAEDAAPEAAEELSDEPDDDSTNEPP